MGSEMCIRDSFCWLPLLYQCSDLTEYKPELMRQTLPFDSEAAIGNMKITNAIGVNNAIAGNHGAWIYTEYTLHLQTTSVG